MNVLEARYACFLEERRTCGEVVDWKFEPIKLRLAKATYYSPDFMVKLADGRIELHETKGFMRDDAAIKLKVAAEAYPNFFQIVLVKWDKQTKDWSYKIYA